MEEELPDFSPASAESRATFPRRAGRLVPLDVLRGLTVAFMILVNNYIRNYAYTPLEHSDWNGWTATDLAFPTFLFLVGISIVLSFESRLGRGLSKSSLMAHTIRRAAILYAIGIVLRAVSYIQGNNMLNRRAVVIAGIAATALTGYWILLHWVPIPGFGMPGRDFPLFDQTHNLGAYIDRYLFPGHLSRGDYDTEGLLGTLLPSTATTLLGVLTALWLRSIRSPLVKASGMLGAGIIGIVLGEIWSQWFPINKKLWTSSYVLFAAGVTLVLLAVFYYLIDIKGLKKGWTWPWLVFGTNAIAAYVISEFLPPVLSWIHLPHHGTLRRLIVNTYADGIQPHPIASLVYSLTIVAISFVPVAVFYCKQIFIKI